MVDRETILKLSKFEDEILEVIDNQDEYTRGDLQGRVMAIVLNIYRAGQKMDKQTSLSVKEMVAYLYHDEKRHFRECDDAQSKKEHIFQDILNMSVWLDEVAKDYEADESR